jgi:hypothetical protein
MLMLLIPFLKYFNNKFERFEIKDDTGYTSIEKLYLYISGYNPDYYYRWTVIDYVYLAIIYIITFLISAGAAYLSFSCTWKDFVTNTVIRAFFAICAFMLGPIYLIWYFIFNYLGNMC